MLDVHAFRHTFITNRARGGVHPKRVQDLARHSDINLTLSRHPRIVLGDRAAALGALSDITEEAHGERVRATGTQDQPFCVCKWEGRTPKGLPLPPDAAKRQSDGEDSDKGRCRLNADASGTSDAIRHEVTR